jgi:hypothetical protein
MAIWGRVMRFSMLVAAAALAGAAIASACGSSSSNNNSTGSPQAASDDLAARVQQDEMLNAWVTISALPIHALDESLQGGTIDTKYVPTLRTLIRVLALTNWTSDVAPVTQKYHDDAVALFKALNAGETADQVKDLSAALHEDSHSFGPTVGNAVAKSLPADAGGPEPTKAPSTPAAGTATPMPAMTP